MSTDLVEHPPEVRVPTLGRVALVSFGPYVLCTALGISAAFVVTPVAVVLGLVAVGLFVAAPIMLWSRLLSGAKHLDAASAAWLAGDPAPAEEAGLRVLRTVFRGDLRARALHLLGLASEQRGKFAQAAELFALAERALPTMAAPVRKRHARTLIVSHRALCLEASGRHTEAARELVRAGEDMRLAGTTGVLDALTDDSQWGIGAASMNEALEKIEHGRDPRAVLSLAWVLHLHGAGAHREVLDLIHREGPVLGRGLLPRENALVARLAAEAHRGGGLGPLRSPAIVEGTPDPWVDACLVGASRHG